MISRLALARGSSLQPSLAVSSSRSVVLVPLAACRGYVSATTPRRSEWSDEIEKERPTAFSAVKRDKAYPKLRDAMADKSRSWMDFVPRHIGPQDADIAAMLKTVGADSLDTFVSQVIPEGILQPPEKTVEFKLDEHLLPGYFNKMISRNATKFWMDGGGYYPVDVPAVIKRNLLENPAWYTSYTPYQAEISQGRLESLLNFQTMVSDLTGLPVANASLLDEGTAAAEAMTMSMNSLPVSRLKSADNKIYVVSNLLHDATIRVMAGRAQGFGIELKVLDFSASDAQQQIKDLGDNLIGVMAQYPDTNGGVQVFKQLADLVHAQGALFSVATDLSNLTLLTPPGEWGADIAFGNSQRWGVPLGFGGPHAAFIATKESNKRRLPGRIVGVSKDRTGRRALRLALQTREQHIRREKATSNVCTAQALLANMSAMYAIYHGPERLREMAVSNLRHARMIQDAAQHYGLEVITSSPDPKGRVVSDTVALRLRYPITCRRLRHELESQNMSCGKSWSSDELVFAVSNKFTISNFAAIVRSFQIVTSANYSDDFKKVAINCWSKAYSVSSEDIIKGLPDGIRRESKYLTHPVFNSHHSETEMLRYMHQLQSKDLSLVHSMIPLGSCTMKLNGTSQMQLIGHNSVSDIHPLAPLSAVAGYKKLFEVVSDRLSALTGMHSTSLQPNSGAQGEFAGLRAISYYHMHKDGRKKRDICLIPTSAHGTNPASAAMAGMRVVPLKCDTATGNLDIADLKAKAKLHENELAAIMITYPSTYGVFEPEIRKVCDIVHEHGGLVYMDGANMNAQIGLTSPGALGADVCHLNLHKTFCIPHGGGGPGVGPICVKKILAPFLPHQVNQTPVSSAPFGSASIVPISWAYMRLMGDDGLRKATSVALLNANYILARLKDHYPILYTNEKGRCAHEFILDARGFSKTAGVEAIDIAKRLQDYGFHAPTMSWPVPNTLMIEPTESESKEELDRFIDALISIRGEIREVEEGRQPREGNVLKKAPHSQMDLILGDEGKWERPYSREKAAYPLPYLTEKKFWPTVTRVDDTYGDTNLFCTCPPVEDTTGAN